MKPAELIDVSAAGFNVEHMSKMIQVRNVPDELHRALKLKAVEEGMSLSDFIKKELSWVSGKATMQEIAERRRLRVRSGRRRSNLKPGEAVEIIREMRGE